MKYPLSLAVVSGLCIFLLGYIYLYNELQQGIALHEHTHITLQKGLLDTIAAKLRKDAEINFHLFVLRNEVIERMKHAATADIADRQALQQELQELLEPVYALLKPMGLKGLYIYDAHLMHILQLHEDTIVYMEPPAAERPEMVRADMEKRPVTCFRTSESGMMLRNIFPILLDNSLIGHAEFIFSHDYILKQLKDINEGFAAHTDYDIIIKKGLLLGRNVKKLPEHYKESFHMPDWLMHRNDSDSFKEHGTTLDDLLNAAFAAGYRDELQRELTEAKPFAIHVPFGHGAASLIFLPILGIQDELQAYTVIFIPRDWEYMKLQDDYKTRLIFLCAFAMLIAFLAYLTAFSYQKQRKITNFLSALVRNIPDGLLVTDSEWRIQESNETACRILGYSREELAGQNPHYLLHYHEGCAIAQKDCPIYKAIIETGSYTGETGLKTKNGEIVSVHVSCSMFQQGNKRHKNTVMVFRDISSQNAARRELQESAGFYAMLMDITTLFLTNDHKRMDETIVYAIGQIARFFEADRCYLCHFSEDYEFLTSTYSWHREGLEPIGISCLEAVKKCGWFVDKLFRQQPVYISNIDELPATAYCERDSMIKGQINALVLIPVMDNAVTTGCYAFEYQTPRRFKEETVSRMIFATDIITNALYKFRFEKQMVHLATTDGLTGLFNRRYFLELAEKEIHIALRYKTPLSMIMFDIDHFKHINDSFGHAIGDEVLRELARRLRQSLRETDFAGRLGGEEFAVICRALPNEACILAERLRKAMEDTQVVCGKAGISFTISLGIAGLQDGAQDITELLKRADDALYKAKNAGRNQTKLWERADT